jgi:hypothetical protein
MASQSNLRIRRSAGQRHALAGVEREIRALDSHSRRKYVREFNQSFRTYESVLDAAQVQQSVRDADIVLIGDYHALPAAQRYAASLIENRALSGGRPAVLGVETIFARDQHILDEWWRREADDAELRQRIRFDLEWGYDWTPFCELLVTARDHAEAVYGLDCMPREDLRKIGARDRHAAAKIAEIRQRHPGAAVFVLFGESHLAPGHLPRALAEQIPDAKILTVLQNIDSLYWRAAGERTDRVEAVRVNDQVLCVFNSTPLEKYESYRLRLDQWSRPDDGPDFAPTVYNLIGSLATFLDINRYSPHNGTQPKFLIDMLPEIYGSSSDALLQRLLMRKGVSDASIESMMARVEQCGSAYLPPVNAFWIREFHMMQVAEDAARFLHHACRGLPDRLNGHCNGSGNGSESANRQRTADRFFANVIEHAIAYFSSRVLYPSRSAPDGNDAQLARAACERAAHAAVDAEAREFESSAQDWGYRIGSRIYDAYIAGKIPASGLRRLFLAPLDEPEEARKVCVAVISRLRSIQSRASR